MKDKNNGSTFPLYDLKEVSKRTYQLGLITLALGLIIVVFYIILQLYISAIAVAAVCLSIGFLLLLNYKGIIKNIKLTLVIMVCGYLILCAAVQGIDVGGYLYFFPFLVVIPIIVDNNKSYLREIILYFSITLFSFGACIFAGLYTTPLEHFTPAQYRLAFFVNAFIAIVLTTGFAYVNIYFERKYLHELMRQKNNSITVRTAFLSTMGHELRTPLNGIIGAINILKHEKFLPVQEEYIQVIKYCSDHMLRQVNDVLDFNKIEAGKMAIYPIEMNIKQVISMCCLPFYNQFEERGLNFILDIDNKLDAKVLADDVRLVQVINNLLSNALKFTQSGYVKLNAAMEGKDEDNIKVNFSVEDTGTGINKMDQHRIFANFEQIFDENTRNFKGSGLGLSICLHILKLMDSVLYLKSDKGKGSTFSFSINFALSKGISKKNEVLKTADFSALNILIVEDNKINMMIVQKLLKDLKAETTSAWNGLEALDVLNSNKNFDIILMDLEMPVMNGYEAITKITAFCPEIPVLAFTASLIDQEMLNSLIKMGFTDYILKPFQPQHLFAQIAKYTNKVKAISG